MVRNVAVTVINMGRQVGNVGDTVMNLGMQGKECGVRSLIWGCVRVSTVAVTVRNMGGPGQECGSYGQKYILGVRVRNLGGVRVRNVGSRNMGRAKARPHALFLGAVGVAVGLELWIGLCLGVRLWLGLGSGIGLAPVAP